MNNILLICLFFLPFITVAQFTDDFNDGQFTDIWSGDDASFIVNDSSWLQLMAPEDEQQKMLSTEIATLGATTWRFKCFYYDFSSSPSSGNHAKIYLASNLPDLSGDLNGYYIQVGGTGSGDTDKIELFRQDGNDETLVCAGSEGTAANNEYFAIEVIRDNSGFWTINLDTLGGENYAFHTGGSDDTYELGNYIGVQVNYTSTRNENYLFDDFYVDPVYVDTEGPIVDSIVVISSTQLDVYFNEALDLVSAETLSHYSVSSGIGNPSMTMLDDNNPSLVHLFFTDEFPNGEQLTLSISDVEDAAENPMPAVQTFNFEFFIPSRFDVLITEVFPDFLPSVALPEAEFIEIFNASSSAVQLGGWMIADATSEATLNNYILQPDSFLILTSTSNVVAYQAFGEVLGVTSFPGLNNDADDLKLIDNFGNLIHTVPYRESWYQDVLKEDGGWTLEMIDPSNPCSGQDNWAASVDPSGGTPGALNSINADNPDNSAPSIETVLVEGTQSIQLISTEILDEAITLDPNLYALGGGLNITSVSMDDAFTILVNFEPAMQAGEIYTVEVAGLTDCAGNVMAESQTFSFGLAETSETGDIIINEILFDPVTGGVDYVEFYNRSSKIIAVNQLLIAKGDIDSMKITQFNNVTSDGLQLFPEQYLAITEDRAKTIEQYSPPEEANILEIDDLPSFDDRENGVVLLNTSAVRIDSVYYLDDWQFELISQIDGVALERISFDGESNDPANWQSAAASVNYGTPGYENSQSVLLPGEPGEDLIQLSSETISPDGDGFEDFLVLQYVLDNPGWTANIHVYDQRGRLIDRIASNELLATDGQFKWEGTDENGERIPIGIYIIHSELFDLNGNINRFKSSIVVASKLN